MAELDKILRPQSKIFVMHRVHIGLLSKLFLPKMLKTRKIPSSILFYAYLRVQGLDFGSIIRKLWQIDLRLQLPFPID